MPNHISNILSFEGDSEKIRTMLESIENDDCGKNTISFDKIIPMPENIFRGNLGKEEREKYGKNNWFDWSLDHWGTKWDAYGFDTFDEKEDGKLYFLTAWCAPLPVIEKLSEMYPDIRIMHEFADEDIGYNCGRITFLNGKVEIEYHPATEEDAVKFALRVNGFEGEDIQEFIQNIDNLN